MIKVLDEKIMDILADDNISIADKIALFDRLQWPKLHVNKESIADEIKLRGNEYFSSQQFEAAITQYNKVLYFTSSREKMGIAYANRSAAYFALQCYRDCLDSVLLARECPLSVNILNKIQAREEMAIECLELEEIAKKHDDELEKPIELSYRRHKLVSSFVHCLSLKDPLNPFGGIVTTKNLMPGDVLVVEPLTAFSFSLCGHCLRSCGSLQPCICGWMFCSPKCKADAFASYHNFECPLSEYLVCYSEEDNLPMRVFFKLIQRFKDVQTLRDYLMDIKRPNPFEIKDSIEDVESFESQFRIYFATEQPSLINCIVRRPKQLCSDLKKNINLRRTLGKTAIIIAMLKTCKQIPVFAKTVQEWSFLSEILYRLFCYQSFTAKLVETSEITYVQRANSDIHMKALIRPTNAIALYGSASLFRSSCEENILMDYANGVLMVRAIKFIPYGSELLCNMR